MRNAVRIFTIVGAAFLLTVSCRDKAAEKRIAQLESRLAELEGKAPGIASATPTVTPAATPAKEKPDGPLPAISFENLDHDFGTINEGEVVEYVYKFKNTGEAPLVIQNAAPSCGCTVPEWSKEPIPVGGEGKIVAKFDSKGKPNIQNKTVTVTANTWPEQTVLRFKAMVVPKEGSSPAQ